MANLTSFNFYHDAALTQLVDSSDPILAQQYNDGSSSPVDVTVYLGSTATGTRLRSTTNPGTDPVVVSIFDSDTGTGAPASEFKLALSSGGLATATAGASLDLSHTILSGVSNAVPVYIRRDSALTAAGVYTDVYPRVDGVFEEPV